MFRLSLLPAAILLTAATAFAAVGDTLGSIPAPFICPQGMAYDGAYLWVADRLSDRMYRVNPGDGTIVDSIETPGYVPRGLAWDGRRLWCVDAAAQLIFAVNPASRIVEKTIWCPVSNPNGLAWQDGQMWVAAEGEGKLHRISPDDGTTIVTIPAPTDHPWGLAFDGTYLWVSDRHKDRIYQVWPKTGDVINCLPTPGKHTVGLAWDGTYLWNADYQSDRIYKLNIDDEAKFTRAEVRAQQMQLWHQVRNFGPDTLKTLDVYMAIPEHLPNQELEGEPVFTPTPTGILTDKWGLKVAHFRFADLGPTDFATVTMTVSANLCQTRYFVNPERIGQLKDIPAEIRRLYLVDDAKFVLNDDIVRKAVKDAVGDETNPYWIGRKLFKYVIDHVDYELAGGWNVAPAVLARGNGSCSEYSFVYIALCRAAGLPARYAGAITVRGDDASYDDVHHRWVEIYLPNYGWLPVDPSGGDNPWPGNQADAFGYLDNRFLITTLGGGGSEYLEWSYNANERWTSTGKCKVEVESFAEWSPRP
jgi:sugar lactone lactonase YvrE